MHALVAPTDPLLLAPQKGETWSMANCSQATCEGNHVISLRPRTCPPASVPTCANGYPAVPVPDQDGCCYQYQCQCEWGRGEKIPGEDSRGQSPHGKEDPGL